MLQFGADVASPLNFERRMLIYVERCLSGFTWRYSDTSLSLFSLSKVSQKDKVTEVIKIIHTCLLVETLALFCDTQNLN